MQSTLPNSLHIIDTTGAGGAETIYIEILESLRKKGANATALLRGKGWLSAQLDAKNIPYLIFNSKGSFNLRFLMYLLKLIRREKIEIVHAHLLGSSVYSSIASALCRTRTISTFHGLVDISSDQRLTRLKLEIVCRLSTVAAVSESVKELIENRIKRPLVHFAVIPNGIDVALYDQLRDDRLRKEYGIEKSDFVIGALGNVRPAKDYETAIRALSHLHTLGHKACLFIAGDPKKDLVDELQILCSQLKVEGSVHFLGFLKDPNSFLSQLDFFISSSTSEGQPLSLFQAMSKALPIVATRSGVESLLEEQSLAWLSPTRDPAALAEKIIEAISNPAEAASRALKARAYVQTHHSKDAMLNAYFSLYKEKDSVN